MGEGSARFRQLDEDRGELKHEESSRQPGLAKAAREVLRQKQQQQKKDTDVRATYTSRQRLGWRCCKKRAAPRSRAAGRPALAILPGSKSQRG